MNLLFPVSGDVRNFSYSSFIDFSIGLRKRFLHLVNGWLNSSEPHSRIMDSCQGDSKESVQQEGPEIIVVK